MPILDLAFLGQQCFGDRALEAELMLLYAGAARRLVAAMAAMPPRAQDEAAHRLRGSSQGIGAWAMAQAARAVENAAPDDRAAAVRALAATLALTEAAIDARLAAG